MRTLIPCAVLALTGCAAIPNTITPEVEHVGHDLGRNAHEAASVLLGWRVTPRFAIAAGPTYLLDNAWVRSHGRLRGQGDVLGSSGAEYTVRGSYTFQVRP